MVKKVLERHKDKPTILVSHDIIFPKVKDDKTIAADSSNGRLIWDELVKNHNHVFMTVNGHFTG